MFLYIISSLKISIQTLKLFCKQVISVNSQSLICISISNVLLKKIIANEITKLKFKARKLKQGKIYYT